MGRAIFQKEGVKAKAKETKSESEEIMTDSKPKETKSESESESKNESKEKANKVKTINRLKNKIRTKLKRQQDKVRKFQALKDSILKFSFLHLSARFLISILLFNSILSNHFYHHFMYPFKTFTSKEIKDCEWHSSLQTKALHSAKTAKAYPAIFESTRLPRSPETRLNIIVYDLHRNTLVPVSLQLTG